MRSTEIGSSRWKMSEIREGKFVINYELRMEIELVGGRGKSVKRKYSTWCLECLAFWWDATNVKLFFTISFYLKAKARRHDESNEWCISVWSFNKTETGSPLCDPQKSAFHFLRFKFGCNLKAAAGLGKGPRIHPSILGVEFHKK